MQQFRSKENYPVKRTFVVSTALLLIFALGLVACASDASQAAAPSAAHGGDPVAGQKIFVSACATCHGSKGEGIPGMSRDMTQSQLIASKTDQELVEFTKLGGVPGEPPVMLPKGGAPSLTDQNLVDVVAYLRTLQE
jgi:mono/diheme cytochrome c family protein